MSFNRHCRSVGVERAPRTLPTRCVPRSSPIRPSACPSLRPRPATARPRALRLATLLRGAGLERSSCWWCHTGKTHWKAVRGGSEDWISVEKLEPGGVLEAAGGKLRLGVAQGIRDGARGYQVPSLISLIQHRDRMNGRVAPFRSSRPVGGLPRGRLGPGGVRVVASQLE